MSYIFSIYVYIKYYYILVAIICSTILGLKTRNSAQILYLYMFQIILEIKSLSFPKQN